MKWLVEARHPFRAVRNIPYGETHGLSDRGKTCIRWFGRHTCFARILARNSNSVRLIYRGVGIWSMGLGGHWLYRPFVGL